MIDWNHWPTNNMFTDEGHREEEGYFPHRLACNCKMFSQSKSLETEPRRRSPSLVISRALNNIPKDFHESILWNDTRNMLPVLLEYYPFPVEGTLCSFHTVLQYINQFIVPPGSQHFFWSSNPAKIRFLLLDFVSFSKDYSRQNATGMLR